MMASYRGISSLGASEKRYSTGPKLIGYANSKNSRAVTHNNRGLVFCFAVMMRDSQLNYAFTA
ncbi:MAG: hypothetical protein JWN70_781 [Planctomycetaceae bacterium]|nr:hypothetical protein [Planctomycetaceae bacterium]